MLKRRKANRYLILGKNHDFREQPREYKAFEPSPLVNGEEDFFDGEQVILEDPDSPEIIEIDDNEGKKLAFFRNSCIFRSIGGFWSINEWFHRDG